MTTLTPSTYIADSVLFIRDSLRANITDPLSRAPYNGVSGGAWIFTSYPTEPAPLYPVITVKKTNAQTKRLGHQSQAQWVGMAIEIRVWARTVKERDSLTQSVHNHLRTHQYGTGGTVPFEMFDFDITSSTPVDEPGENGIHSEVMACEWYAILTG